MCSSDLDTLYGGAGSDLYIVDNPGDQVVEPAGPPGGILPVLVSSSTAGAQGFNPSSNPVASADARYVAFTSTADLTTGNNLGQSDVFVKDVQTGTLTRVSSGFSGLGGGGGNVSISGDGRFVLFDSPAGNLVAGDTNVAYDVFIRDMQGGIQRVSTDSNGVQADASSQNATFSADRKSTRLNSSH